MSSDRYHVESRRGFARDGREVWLMRRDAKGYEVLGDDGVWRPNEGDGVLPFPQPTFFFPRDSWEALVRHVLTDKYGALPHDQLLRDRLDIETERVNKLLEAVIS